MKTSVIRLNNQFELDLGAYELHKSGRVIRLEKMPMELLILLAEKQGQLVTREEIVERLWGDNVFVDARQGVNTAVHKIRLATKDDPERPRVLETVVGKGYRLLLADDPNPAPVVDMPETGSVGTTRQGHAAWLLLAAAVLISTVGAVRWWRSEPKQVLGVQPGWTQLTNLPDPADCPTLAPDGRMLAFVRGGCNSTGEIYVQLLPGGKPTQLTHTKQVKGAPTFSTDGSRIAYSVLPRWDTWVVPVLGGEPQLMLSNASGLKWIDEKHVVFSELKRGMHMGIVTAGENRTDERDVYLPAQEVGMAHASRLSPDGKWLLVVEMDAQGWTPCRLLPFDGSSPGTTVGPPASPCIDAAWSLEGNWMFLNVDTGSGFHIWRQRSADLKPERLTDGPTEQWGIAVAPDGRSLLSSVGMWSSSVWVHDKNGTRQIAFEGSAAFPIPQKSSRAIFEGVKLYFVGQQKPRDSWDLWATDLNSGQSDRVVLGMPVDSFDISRDGQQVAFESTGPPEDALQGGAPQRISSASAGVPYLWIADLDHHSAPHLLAPDSAGRRPLFTPANDLVFEADEGSATYAYLRSVQDGARRKITPGPIVRLQTISPDGRWVLAEAPVLGEDVTRGITAFDVRDGKPKRVCHGLCVVRWTLDGKCLFLSLPGSDKNSASWFGAKTFVVPLRRGQSFPPLPLAGFRSDTELLRLPGVKVIDELSRPGSDASVYAFDRAQVQANIYRIPLPK